MDDGRRMEIRYKWPKTALQEHKTIQDYPSRLLQQSLEPPQIEGGSLSQPGSSGEEGETGSRFPYAALFYGGGPRRTRVGVPARGVEITTPTGEFIDIVETSFSTVASYTVARVKRIRVGQSIKMIGHGRLGAAGAKPLTGEGGDETRAGGRRSEAGAGAVGRIAERTAGAGT